MQKNHIEYPQAKGAPAGSFIGGIILREALRRQYYEDLPSDSPVNIALNPATGLLRVSAIGGGVFMAAKEDVNKTESVQASDTLTIADNPTHGDTMQIGDQEYVFKAGITGKATAKLTLTGAIQPATRAQAIMTVSGGNIVGGVHAESVVTANTIIDGSQITIGSRTYTFKTALSAGPTVADEVLIGGSDAVALDNLKLAINAGAGIGTNYSIGTVVNADVIATDNADTTQKVVARASGTAANALATTSLDGTLSWPDTTLGGGTGASNPGVAGNTVTVDGVAYVYETVLAETLGLTAVPNEVLLGANDEAALLNLKKAINGEATEGTNYSTGTTQPTGAEATAVDATTITVTSLVNGSAGDFVVAETGAFIAWNDTTPNGIDGEQVVVNDKTYTFVAALTEDFAAAVPNEVLFGANSAEALDNLKLAVNLGATEGTNYSTGTTAPTDVTATTNTNTEQTFEAVTAGVGGNAYPSTTNIVNGSFADTTFDGGYADDGKTIVLDSSAGATQTRVRAAINGTGTPGTDYSAALIANELVTCGAFGTNVATILAQAAGAAGNGIETTETFTSSNNLFSAAATAGGADGANFDAFIPAGETFDYAPDEDVTQISLIAIGASTDVVVLEY